MPPFYGGGLGPGSTGALAYTGLLSSSLCLPACFSEEDSIRGERVELEVLF